MIFGSVDGTEVEIEVEIEVVVEVDMIGGDATSESVTVNLGEVAGFPLMRACDRNTSLLEHDKIPNGS